MAEAVFAIPGDLKAATGGYAYDRRVIELLPAFGVPVSVVPLPASFPNPAEKDLETTRKALLSRPDGSVLIVDGLAFGAFLERRARRDYRVASSGWYIIRCFSKRACRTHGRSN